MAVRISRATDTSAESWLFMQAKLDLWLAENRPALNVTPFEVPLRFKSLKHLNPNSTITFCTSSTQSASCSSARKMDETPPAENGQKHPSEV